MVGLFQLPNEVLGRIIQVADPSDLESLAYSSKFMYALAGRALKRHRKLERYSVLDFSHFRDSAEKPVANDRTNPLLLLISIIQDPEVVDGPKKLRLGPILDVDDIHERIMQEIKKQSRAIEALIRECCFIPEAKREEWLNNFIKWNDRDAAIALLITLLPNLEILDALDWSYLDGIIATRNMVDNITKANLDKESPLHGKAMTHLQEFHMCRSDEYAENMDDYAPFAILPSMRVLSGSHIAGLNFTWAPSCIGEFFNITEINFTYSAIELDSFETMLSRISGLKKFTYSLGDYMVALTSYSPWGYVEALRRYAASTLELLDITVEGPRYLLSHEDKEREFIGSLEVFRCLKFVRLNDVAFQKIKEIGNDHEPLLEGEIRREDLDGSVFKVEIYRLIDVLPPSVESVTLLITTEDQDLWRMFRGLVGRNQIDLPRLHSISLEGWDPLEMEMRGSLKGVGIELKNWDVTL